MQQVATGKLQVYLQKILGISCWFTKFFFYSISGLMNNVGKF